MVGIGGWFGRIGKRGGKVGEEVGEVHGTDEVEGGRMGDVEGGCGVR